MGNIVERDTTELLLGYNCLQTMSYELWRIVRTKIVFDMTIDVSKAFNYLYEGSNK